MNFISPEDFKLLEDKTFKKDKPFYELISHNLDNKNCKIITDNQDYAIVFGDVIWIWIKNKKEDIYLKVKEELERLINELLTFVCQEDFYNYLQNIHWKYLKEKPYICGCYECKKLIVPKKVNGKLDKPTIKDTEYLAKCFEESLDYPSSWDINVMFVTKWINSNNFYVWRDDKIVAYASYNIHNNMAELSNVYTLPLERGKGYMPNLIYKMIEIILKSKLRPIVYTNYEYVSSNKCYQKVGFELECKLIKFNANKI